MLPALKILHSDDSEDVDGGVRLGLRLPGVVLRQRLLLALLTTVLGDLTHRARGVRQGLGHRRADIFVQATTCNRSHDKPDAASHATRASQAMG